MRLPIRQPPIYLLISRFVNFPLASHSPRYIEISKRRISSSEDPIAARQARRTLVYVLDTCLRLLHPFMPFITEELWQRLPHKGEALMISPWPERRGGGALPIDYEALALIWNH